MHLGQPDVSQYLASRRKAGPVSKLLPQEGGPCTADSLAALIRQYPDRFREQATQRPTLPCKASIPETPEATGVQRLAKELGKFVNDAPWGNHAEIQDREHAAKCIQAFVSRPPPHDGPIIQQSETGWKEERPGELSFGICNEACKDLPDSVVYALVNASEAAKNPVRSVVLPRFHNVIPGWLAKLPGLEYVELHCATLDVIDRNGLPEHVCVALVPTAPDTTDNATERT